MAPVCSSDYDDVEAIFLETLLDVVSHGIEAAWGAEARRTLKLYKLGYF